MKVKPCACPGATWNSKFKSGGLTQEPAPFNNFTLSNVDLIYRREDMWILIKIKLNDHLISGCRHHFTTLSWNTLLTCSSEIHPSGRLLSQPSHLGRGWGPEINRKILGLFSPLCFPFLILQKWGNKSWTYAVQFISCSRTSRRRSEKTV